MAHPQLEGTHCDREHRYREHRDRESRFEELGS